MDNIIDISTGEVKVGRNNKILVSNAIGSCVAVLAIDIKNNIGGIAHIMLSGKSPAKEKFKTKYAFNAINELFNKMRIMGAAGKYEKVFIVGGGNILKLKNNDICEENIGSIIELLKDKGIHIHAKAVRGTKRRSVSLDIHNKVVYFSEGSGANKILWRGQGKEILKEI